MTASELRTEILSGPLAATLAAPWAAGDDAGVARLLSAKTFTGFIPASELRKLLVQINLMPKLDLIRTHLLMPSANGVVPSVAATFGLFVIASRLQYILDAGLRAEVAEMASGSDSLIAAGLMTEQNKTAVLALEQKISRIQVAFGVDSSVSAEAVAEARKAE
jgi:hypothetical protein